MLSFNVDAEAAHLRLRITMRAPMDLRECMRSLVKGWEGTDREDGQVEPH
jgi:hypothetical protein